MENTGMEFKDRDLLMSRLIESGRDTRYSIHAYEFVYMIFSVLEKVDVLQEKEFFAQDIVECSVKTATALYGPIAEFVLADMGIKSAKDIGAIISNLVDLNVFSESNVEQDDAFSYLARKPLFARVRPKPLNMEKLKFFEDT